MISNFIKITVLIFLSFNLWVFESKQQDTSKAAAAKKAVSNKDVVLYSDKSVGSGTGLSIKGAPGYVVKLTADDGAPWGHTDDSSKIKSISESNSRCYYYFIHKTGTNNFSLSFWWMRESTRERGEE